MIRWLFVLTLGLAWMLGTRVWYFCGIRGTCQVSKPEKKELPASLVLKADDNTLVSGYEQFSYAWGSITPDVSRRTNNARFLEKILGVFRQYPYGYLQIKGYYRHSESGKKSGPWKDLGLARAALIRDLLYRKGVDSTRIHIASGMDGDALREPLEFHWISLQE